jgi:hypothetical protein
MLICVYSLATCPFAVLKFKCVTLCCIELFNNVLATSRDIYVIWDLGMDMNGEKGKGKKKERRKERKKKKDP